MAETFDALGASHIRFIEAQHMFFVATAAAEGRVNLSPKGMDSLRVLGPNRVVWLNVTGSGNETAAHILQNPRMTLMFAGFTQQPLILRLYGTARAVHQADDDWQQLAAQLPALPGARQIFDLSVDLVQTSCGYAVPFYDHKGPRETLNNWATNKGEEGLRDYWRDKNRASLDGFDTRIVAGNRLDDDQPE